MELRRRTQIGTHVMSELVYSGSVLLVLRGACAAVVCLNFWAAGRKVAEAEGADGALLRGSYEPWPPPPRIFLLLTIAARVGVRRSSKREGREGSARQGRSAQRPTQFG
jgi:hypothetical protein